MQISPRAEILLRALVERYIADGQPVGSRTLARASGMDLSPATIRNVMSDLEELGFVSAPHTSAGRIPTERGYRFFIDTLLKVQPLTAAEVRRLRGEFDPGHDSHHLIETASQMLSEVSQLAGIVMASRRDEQVAFRHLDFVQLSDKRVLAILVTQDAQVHNRILTTEREYSASELEQAANYFNTSYAGVSLNDIKRSLVKEMQQASDDLNRAMQLALRVANEAFDDKGDDKLFVSGEEKLMDFPDLGDIKKLRRLFEAFNSKRDLLHLLDRSLRAGGVKIFIGAESGFDVLKDCSLVTAPYSVDGQIVGTLGVIGPTRMAYEHVIPVVDMTAKLLSNALSSSRTLEEDGVDPNKKNS
ncbi:MAG TPA: heat-inducible transcriptional repressor HrcA [Burkholderiales bacterium]|nr:heat-inducible transcriptional repressor HrcA [Burkholderiales bacterium]